jgi:hypothetical protein
MSEALIPIAAQAVGGGLQALFSGTKKRQKELEALTNNSPQYNGGGSIRDTYNKALQRYNVNPYTGTLYNTSMQQNQRATNQGLSALSDRKNALSGVGKLIAIQNDANLRAGVAAENDQARRFQALDSAGRANAAEDKYQYQTNTLSPYLRRLTLAQQKAAGAAATRQAGLQNIFGALNSAATLLSDSDNGTKSSTSSTPQVSIFNRDKAIQTPTPTPLMWRNRLNKNDEYIDGDYGEQESEYNYRNGNK